MGVVWFICAVSYGNGEVSVSTLGILLFPTKFEWKKFQEIELGGVGETLSEADTGLGFDADELKVGSKAADEFLTEAKAWIYKYGWGYTFFLCVVWPVACIPFGDFGKSTFQLWAAVALCWGWGMGSVIIALPIYESLEFLMGSMGGKKSSTMGATAEVKTADA